MKEPLVGTLLVSVNVVFVRAVGDVPHWTLTLQLNVVPISLELNVSLSCRLTRFLPGPSVRTPVFSGVVVNEPSVTVISTLTYIVTVLEPLGPLLIPNFHVCVPPVFDSESL